MSRAGKIENKNRNGFTLVELMVAIALIGILASVVLVSLVSQRTKAKKMNVMTTMESYLPILAECELKGKLTYSTGTSPNLFQEVTPGQSFANCSDSAPTPVVDYPACTGTLIYQILSPNYNNDYHKNALLLYCDYPPGTASVLIAECYYGGPYFGQCNLCDDSTCPNSP